MDAAVSSMPVMQFARDHGASAPLYLLAYDKAGRCTSPASRAQLLAALAGGNYRDIHLYCHGWNNLYNDALAHYREFFSEYFKLRSSSGLNDVAYQPLVIGLIWPSALQLSPQPTPQLAPGDILSLATLYLMKDRAGVIGAAGVHDLLQDLLDCGPLRLHLCGHSYGAKLLLSALTRLAPGRKVASLLLLQPAVNAYCFAESITGQGGAPGGYRPVLDKVGTPIFSTWSRLDKVLLDIFPLSLRRGRDLGEQGFAGIESQYESKYAALGAVGPRGMRPGERGDAFLPAPPLAYGASPAGVRVMALDGSQHAITGHGDVRNPYTEWAMAQLVQHSLALANQ